MEPVPARSAVITCGKPLEVEQQFKDIVADTFRLMHQLSDEFQPGAKTIKTLQFYSKIVVAPYVNCIKFAMQWIRDSVKPACINLTLRTATFPALPIDKCQEIAQNEDWVPAFSEEPETDERLLIFIPEAEDLLSPFVRRMDSVQIFSAFRIAYRDSTHITNAVKTYEHAKELENALLKERLEKEALQTELKELRPRLKDLQAKNKVKEERCASLEKEKVAISELCDFQLKKLAEENSAMSQMCEFQTIKIIELRKSSRTAAKELADAKQKCALLETRLRDWGITSDLIVAAEDSVPDYFTSESRATLDKFGPYSGNDEEPLLVKLGPVYDDDAVYIGQWNCRNLPHGYGEMRWIDGSIYEGQWREGLRTGKGRYIHENGDVYIGDFVKGYKEGFGSMYYTDGSIYSGTWVNDKKQGIGSLKYGQASKTPGDYYIGEYVDDQRSGPGAYFHQDGGFYMGLQLLNKLHGKGLMSSPEGEMYFGEYDDDKMSGFGSFLWANNSVYRGEWKQDIMHGMGTLTHAGEFYQGGWAFNLRNGEGFCKLPNGAIERCVFNNGQFQQVLPNVS